MTAPTFSWLYGPDPVPADRICPTCSIPHASPLQLWDFGMCWPCVMAERRNSL